MIYDHPETQAPIRQGDIFVGLPRIELPLRRLSVIGDDNSVVEREWRQLARSTSPVTMVVAARSVAAIVATQDCDAVYGRDITLCEIRPFAEVDAKGKDAKSPKSWKSLLTQHARINQKWFYLPPDAELGFGEKMAVDFGGTLRIARKDLAELRELRAGRLNPIADEHFRERIGEYFRRYPYDEWYALDPDELVAYRHDYPDVKPFPWQQP